MSTATETTDPVPSTNERGRWVNVDCGPIQVNRFNKAIRSLVGMANTSREAYGIIEKPETHRFSTSQTLFGTGVDYPAAVAAKMAIGDKYGWKICRSKVNGIIAEIEATVVELGKNIPLKHDHRITQAEHDARNAQQAARDEEQRRLSAKRKEVWAKVAALAPRGAQAVILAIQEHDDCDSMTDYYNTKMGRSVVIGFRMSAREDFRALRAAAGAFPETAHLGLGKDKCTVVIFGTAPTASDPNPVGKIWEDDSYQTMVFWSEADAKTAFEAEIQKRREAGDLTFAEHGWRVSVESVEQRDNYSMGRGNYLKAENRYSTGWYVRSMPMTEGSIYPDTEICLPEQSAAVASAPSSESVGGATIHKTLHTKRGYDIWIVVPEARLSDEDFGRLRSACNAAGGWYSRKWGSTPGGFAFQSEPSAQAFAAANFAA